MRRGLGRLQNVHEHVQVAEEASGRREERLRRVGSDPEGFYADLITDCGFRTRHRYFPERFLDALHRASANLQIFDRIRTIVFAQEVRRHCQTENRRDVTQFKSYLNARKVGGVHLDRIVR